LIITAVRTSDPTNVYVYFYITFLLFKSLYREGLDGRSSISGRGKVLLHSVQIALGPTRPPIQWIPEALSIRVKMPGHIAGHSPIYFYGIVRN
jgi:hypothetical protein